MTANLKRTAWEEENGEYPETEISIKEKAEANLQSDEWLWNVLAYEKELICLIGSLGFEVVEPNLEAKFDEFFARMLARIQPPPLPLEQHLARTLAKYAFLEGHLLGVSDRRLSVAKDIGKQLSEKAYQDAENT